MSQSIPLPADVALLAPSEQQEQVPWHRLDVRGWSARTLSAEHSAEEGVRASVERIDRLNPTYNAVSVLLEREALAQARALDEAAEAEDFRPGALHGVPILIKEEVDVRGCPTTFGTNANPTPKDEDSLIVTRLREAGAIILGKTLMPAFGAFPFTESEAFGITRNPYDPQRTPGGSSGGSAVAVATGMVPVAIGGDGGGSIRIPSAHCGLTGLKPARGSVPTAPYADLWLALGTSGPIARCVEDCAIVFDVISAQQTSRPHELGALAYSEPLTIGVSTAPATPGMRVHKDHLQGVRRAWEALEESGHTVREVTLDHPDPTAAFVVQFLGGIAQEIRGFEFPDRIEARHKRTKALALWVTPKVQQWAMKFSERFGSLLDEQLDGLDALLTPALAHRPSKVGKGLKYGTLGTQIASLPSIAFSAQWNVSGHAAMALPVGLGGDGLPVGVQLVGPRGEADLLRVSRELERVLREHA
ncbi:Acylamidase [Corynebacterium urogenitale]|uniref:amidase n=1 Tax=Corynebacterium urogenitale TaxID=2487892 RepID=A0A5J6Z7Z4_9CORY|nr:amidase family protein [Corynebacterium urogenitale]QFQ02312.1 Acylamidase [Corynebacterium urogenitale]